MQTRAKQAIPAKNAFETVDIFMIGTYPPPPAPDQIGQANLRPVLALYKNLDLGQKLRPRLELPEPGIPRG